LSFVGVDDGWALASAGCLGGPGVCTAIYNTTNGTTWHRLPDAPFNVGGAGGDIGCEASSPCVDGIRFANATDGYVFGNAALYMTTDGGDTWARQSGFGADSLEIGGGMVTRISIDNVPHPVVEQAPVGSTTWTPIRLPGGTPITQIGGGVSVGGSGQLAVIAVTDYAESKGDGVGQQAIFYYSTDNGAHWVKRADPCPPVGAKLNDDAAAMTTAPDGTIVVYCGIRSSLVTGTTLRASTITSTDNRQTYSTPHNQTTFGELLLLAAANQATQLVLARSPNAEQNTLYRSTSTGQTWTPVTPFGHQDIQFIGFQSGSIGRVVTNGNKMWTTRDGGDTWTPTRIS